MRFNPLLSVTLATLPLSSCMPTSPPETPITAGFDLAVRAPEPMPQQENTGSFFLGTPDHNSGTKLPPPDPTSWQNSLTPNQTSKSCHGSIICPFTGQACQYAASRFDDSLLYRNFTSYTYKLGNAILLHSCAAVFSCDNDEQYTKGMTGAQIKGAFWNIFHGAGKHCKHCGSSNMKSVGCRVSVGYCLDCHDDNNGLAIPIIAP